MRTKGSTGSGRVTNARVGKTHKPGGASSGKGAGVNKRDSATANSSGAGTTMKYRSGDVKVTTGSMAKYSK